MLIPLFFYGSEHHWILVLTYIITYDSISYRLFTTLGICSSVQFSAETLTNCQDCNCRLRLLFDGRTNLDGEGCSVRAGSGKSPLCSGASQFAADYAAVQLLVSGYSEAILYAKE